MEFDSSVTIATDRQADLCAFLNDWFQTNAAAKRADCDIRFWNVDAARPVASCEHLTRAALRRLTKAIQRRFPEIDTMRIGTKFDGVPSGLDFKWIGFKEHTVEMDGVLHQIYPFAVSTFQVSLGQFTEFMTDSGYVPECDEAKYSGFLESHVKINWGESPKTPVFGVTLNDALAFCAWANVRLPSEIELHHYFVQEAQAGRLTAWVGECWTTTKTPSGDCVLRNGPYPAMLKLSIDRFRFFLPADHYDYPFPTFRVARSLDQKAGP